MTKHILITTDRKKDSIQIFQEEPAIVVLADRKDLHALKKIDYVNYSGIYVLFGENKRYIGQASNNILDRLNRHDAQKDWWNRVLFFTKSANDLGKHQTDYLEKKLITLFSEVTGIELDNGTVGNTSFIDIASKMTAENLWEVAQSILEEVANVDMFEVDNEEVVKVEMGSSTGYTIFIDKKKKIEGKSRREVFINFFKYLDERFPTYIQENVVEGRPLNRVDGNVNKILGTQEAIGKNGNALSKEIKQGVHLYCNLSDANIKNTILMHAKNCGILVEIQW